MPGHVEPLVYGEAELPMPALPASAAALAFPAELVPNIVPVAVAVAPE
jgi:hypothetical protein